MPEDAEVTQIMGQRGTGLFRKPRSMEDILRDAAFSYQVGRLTGAATMVAHFLLMQEDDDLKSMGVKLGEVVGWFYEDEGR